MAGDRLLVAAAPSACSNGEAGVRSVVSLSSRGRHGVSIVQTLIPATAATTSRLYRAFFSLYAAAHVLGGALIWAWPPALEQILTEPLSRGAATIAGFLSIMVGCGFAAAGTARSHEARRAAVWAATVSNAVNGAGHIFNITTGASPSMLLPVVALGIGGFAVMLVVLERRLAAGMLAMDEPG